MYKGLTKKEIKIAKHYENISEAEADAEHKWAEANGLSFSGQGALSKAIATVKERRKQMVSMRLDPENIEGMKERCYRELSGGQQQRVLLARALCATSKLLLLDEPVSGLDPRATSEMYGLVEQLNREGMTVVMISHDIAAAARYATHMLHIGDRVFYGTVEAYRRSALGRRFLDAEGGEGA